MTAVVRPVAPRDADALEAFLRSGGPADAWMLHCLAEGGLQGFLGAFEDGRTTGAVLFRRGALCAASRTTDAAARALVPAIRERGAWYSIVGPEGPCSVLAGALSVRMRPRVDRVQLLMAQDDAARLGPGEPGLRAAGPRDLDELVPLVAAYRLADGLSTAGDDLLDWVRGHVRERIEAGVVHVVADRGRIVFTGAFNFLGPEGCGLGGIYTVPDARGRGVAARAVASLCRIGLASGPVATLHVDRRNTAAIRAYERAGLVRAGLYRLTFR